MAQGREVAKRRWWEGERELRKKDEREEREGDEGERARRGGRRKLREKIKMRRAERENVNEWEGEEEEGE